MYIDGPIEEFLPDWAPDIRHAPGLIPHFLSPKFPLQADVVHSIVEFPYGITATRVARRRGIASVITGHGTYSVRPLEKLPDSWFFKKALRSAGAITVSSAFTAREIQRHLGSDLEIEVLPPSIDLTRFGAPLDHQEARARLGLRSDSQVILSVGAIKRRKGFDVLIEAFAEVLQRRPNTELVVIGGGSRTHLEEQVDRLGVSPNVHFLGRAEEQDIIAAFQICDVFSLLPRNVDSNFEGLGVVFLEAGACEKPIVASESGGVPEAVVHGENGLLVPEDDAAAAATSILTLLTDSELASKLGRKGYERSTRNSWRMHALRLIEIYQELAAKVGAR
jgi:phosphatidylinositol alpha-1,6-mannosyltransferase